MPIAQWEGKALVFNNGVVDVVQGSTSLVDSEKVAHIPDNLNDIDNRTIIVNAEDKLEVPFDNQTIYVDQDGFVKARGGEVHDSKIILCTQVGSDPAGPVGSFTLNQDSNKTITIPIPEPEVKEYTGGTDIEVTSEGIINYIGSGGAVEIDNQTLYYNPNNDNKLQVMYSDGLVLEPPYGLRVPLFRRRYPQLGMDTSKTYVLENTNSGGGDPIWQPAWVEKATQKEFTAGVNVQISSEGVISATDTTYSAGSGISISSEGVISATGGGGSSYTAGNGIDITNNVISSTITYSYDSNTKTLSITSV